MPRQPAWWNHHDWRCRLLSPIGAIYMKATAHRVHQQQQCPALPIPVICIGNIVAGGSGKTPVLKALGSYLQATWNVHALTRGYGGYEKGPVRIDPHAHTAQQVGDEALEIAEIMPCWVARNRAEGVTAAWESGADMVLMDDGLQNPRIKPDKSLLVIDGNTLFGNRHGIPAGPLRERPQHVWNRVTAVIITGIKPDQLATIRPELTDMPDDMAVFSAHPQLICTPAQHNYIAFSGIGTPEKFNKFLKNNDINILYHYDFPDHHPYTEHEISKLRISANTHNARLITTRKDFVRLTPAMRQDIEVADIKMVIDRIDDLVRLIT